LVALDGVDLTIAPGTVTGLIGPNGAGKTTLLNVLSGLVRPSRGRVLIDGREVRSASVAARARLGVGRTYQQPELFESLSVRDAVALGREAALAGGSPFRQVLGRSQTTHDSSSMVDEALAICGLATIEGHVVSELSTAQRRLVELARCLAWPFNVLLLDEPTAGLDAPESARLADVVRDVVAARGVGVLLVEHDVSVVLKVCSTVAVLDFGRLLIQADTATVMADETVKHAYLGSSPAALS
jgi:ABC-type branched-subunit amino acid transport system ATPase component